MKQICVLFWLIWCQQSWALSVTLINPSTDETPFWNLVTELTLEASKDLGIDIKVENAGGNRLFQSDICRDIAKQKNKPDFVIFMPYGGTIVESFKILEAAEIPFVTIGHVYDWPAFIAKQGLPQEQYKYWLGEIFQDNVKAGALLTKELVKIARKHKGADRKLNVVGFNGDYYSESMKRASGLRQFIENDDKLYLNQIIPAQWNREEAKTKFLKLQQRYKNIDVVWAASDSMALGVIDATKTLSITANKDVFVGGFDIIPAALTAIQNEHMTATIGGHFLQGVLALIRIYDHHQGLPVFKKGDDTAYIQMQLINKSNVADYHVLSQPLPYEHIDFKRFTLTHSKNKQYQLNAKHFVEVVKQAKMPR